jgi:hypothetical protein
MKTLCTALFVVLNFYASSAQPGPYTASFIGRMGVDTVLVETYTMIDNHLYGKAFIRVPEDYIGLFSIHFYPDGTIREFNVTAMDPSNSSLPFKAKTGDFEYRLNMNCANDSCIFYNSRKGSPAGITLKHKADKMDFVGGWVPLISLLEWNCMRLAKSTRYSLPLKMINHYLGVYPIEVRFANQSQKGTMIFGGPFLEYTRIAVDDDRRIKNTDGIGTPWNYIVTRHSPIDVDALAKRMTMTKGIGVPSPEEDIETVVKSCSMELHYGRPYKRGRKIFGGVVPYDSVWRTGAGRPTTLSFSEDIRIGKVVVPRGKYSLYTIPRQGNWLLIFNRDVTRWPTDPDRSKDVASVVIPAENTSRIQDQFTIEIAETKNGGVLRFQWDDTVASAEFQIAKK